MMFRIAAQVLTLFLVFSACGSTVAWAEVATPLPPRARVLILVGAGGEERYVGTFDDWASRLRRFLIGQSGIPEANILQLGGKESDRGGGATRESIESALEPVALTMETGQDLWIFLIGHGSYIAGESRFVIDGPDVRAEDFIAYLEKFDGTRIIMVNSTASSAGFINALSGTDRIIVTATKSTLERNATQFMDLMLRGLEDGTADQNRDGRISLLEAARQAALLTRSWYEDQGYIVSEHPLIDDNGDGLGTRLIPEEEGGTAAVEMSIGEGVMLDGARAARYFLKDFSFPPEVPEALVQRYKDQLEDVEQIRSRKKELDLTEYRRQLEPLLIEAARTHREIRRIVRRVEGGSSGETDSQRKANVPAHVPSQ